MTVKTENLNPVQLSPVEEIDEVSPSGVASSRKAFVEPEISFPIDVLEATTFFQFSESGVSN